jgi:hypothetical protein
MHKSVLFASLFFIFSLTACSEVRPFIDSRREAGEIQPVGQSRPDRIAVCYNPIWDDKSDYEELAVQACSDRGKKAVYDTTAYFNCRLLLPNTAFYKCR